MSHAYDSKFMQYADTSSKHAARTVAQGLMAKLNISSVLDVGCAKGTWLNAWRELGATDIQGVDGELYTAPGSINCAALFCRTRFIETSGFAT